MSTAEVKASIDSLNEFIDQFQEAVKLAREKFILVIKDKSIPLGERWELFKKAPTELKNNGSWIESFKALNEACGGEVSWYDDFCKERHETVHLVDLVSDVEWCIENDQVDRGYCKAFFDKPELLDKFKEEILEKNIESFEYDW